MGIIIVIIGIVGIVGLWFIGFQLRRGIETKKALKRVARDAGQQGHQVNQRWHDEWQKANLRIALPIAGLLGLYVLILLFFSSFFLSSLLGLLLTCLGFFGIIPIPIPGLDLDI